LANDTIRVIPGAVHVQAAAADQTICLGSSAVLQTILINPVPGDQYHYHWAPALDTVANPSVTPSANTTYHVTVTNQFGCSDTVTFHVAVTGIHVTAKAQPDTVFSGQQTILTATAVVVGGNGNTTYSWTPANLVDNPNNAVTTAHVDQTTTFTVTAINGDCVDTAQVTVYLNAEECVEPFIFIPKAFTPNNDGNNDNFMVRGVNIKSLHLIIWNRWGEKVYETTDPNDKGWDGTFRGKELTPDSYAWYLEAYCVHGGYYQHKGDVTLLK
jgi:gliding motility-associated-like protein